LPFDPLLLALAEGFIEQVKELVADVDETISVGGGHW
jgi:hypothetical protein